jgi:hypothetical protein
MKVGTSAVPALPHTLRCIGSWLKDRTDLLWPDIAFRVRGGKGRIFTSAPEILHKITLLCTEIYAEFFTNFCVEFTMGKRKNEPLHLKDSFLHLKTYNQLKFTLDK